MAGQKKGKAKSKPPFPVFLATTIVVFFCALSAADSIGFVPDYIDGSTPLTTSGSNSSNELALSDLPQLGVVGSATVSNDSNSQTALPVRIRIPAASIDLPVQNPPTRDVSALDALLQKGPARYVDSAKLGAAGNLVIFAHSSHLPIVHNQMYKAFNNIPNLKSGDMITIEGSDGKDYLYSVDSVTKADVNDAAIDLSASQGTKLTLVTCDTLTGKSARFVLTASFIGTIGQ
jgi:LPXTG-site transpeptidase (sortase) family protein